MNATEIIEASLNKTPEEISDMYDILRNAIRNYVSRVLEDNKVTESNPFEVDTSLDYGACGLSDLELQHVESIFREEDDEEGMIWCNVEWTDEPVDFDEFTTDDQMAILRSIK